MNAPTKKVIARSPQDDEAIPSRWMDCFTPYGSRNDSLFFPVSFLVNLDKLMHSGQKWVYPVFFKFFVLPSKSKILNPSSFFLIFPIKVTLNFPLVIFSIFFS